MTPGNGMRRRAGLEHRDARQGCDQDLAGLGHPPRVHDRAAIEADDFAVPHPGFGVDRLADRAQHAQTGQVVPVRVLLAPLHERSDRRRRGVQDGDAVLLDQRPEAILVGIVGRAFVHDHRGAVGQRAVHDVRVTGDPADVGRAPEDVFFLQVEDVLVRRRRADQVAARGVQHALRLARRARRVQDVQRVLGVQRLGLDHGRARLIQGGVPPHVAP